MKDHSKLFNGIKNYTRERLLGAEPSADPYHVYEMFGANAFAVMCSETLKKLKVNPEMMLMYARMNLAFENEETAFLVLINRQRKIKDIHRFAIGYKAKISIYEKEIAFLCKTNKTNRFVVIFNYNYRGTPFDELYDIDKFFRHMTKKGFKMMDCIKVLNGQAVSIITPYYDGYKN